MSEDEYIQTISDLGAKTRKLEIISEISDLINSTFNFDDIFRTAVQETKKIVAFDGASISLLDETGQKLITYALVTDKKTKLGVGYIYKKETGVEQVIDHKVPNIAEDLSLEMKTPIHEALLKEGIRSYISIPLTYRGTSIGTFDLCRRKPSHYADCDLETLQQIANRIAVAIQNAQLFKEVQKSEEKYRSLINKANDAIFIINADNGEIIEANPKAEELTGYKNSELAGKKIWEIHPQEEMESAKGLFQLVSSQGSGVYDDMSFTRKDKSRVFVDVSAAVIEYGDTKVIQRICRDVTERKELQRQLTQSNKLAAVGELSAAIAHEIRNPLGGISTSVGILKDSLDLDGEEKELLDIISNESERLNSVISDFLKFARPQEPHLEEVDGNELLKETMLLLKEKIQKSVELGMKLCEDLPSIDADLSQLKQVFINIVLNALESMEASGRLEISSEIKGKIHKRKCISISFSDTGKGIDQDKLEKIFQPFYSDKENGTGLGLSICHRIIQNHRGDIIAESKPGVGSKFTILLPIP